MAPHTWAIVLAGGQGRRVAGVTGGIPKQFWRVKGEATLLDRTLHRLAPLTRPGQTVVVVDREHEPYVRSMDDLPAHVLYQPQDRGTAAGVLLALLPILDFDPDAVVVLSPSDHAVADAADFLSGLELAIGLMGRRAGVVLFGVEPEAFDGSYGWIRPGRPVRPAWLRAVDGFVEKPGPELATELSRSEAIWNTMVLVADVGSLFALFDTRHPALTTALVSAWRNGATRRDEALAEAYAGLGALDFSRDVITGADGLTVYTWPASMGWSDLGTPDRLFAWLEAPARPDRARISAA